MTVSSDWHETLDEIWAKSPAPESHRGETLREHTWNLMVRLEALARLRPGLQDRFRISRLWLILCRAAWLHDWGKAAKSFQRMLRGDRIWHHRHEVLSLLWVDWCSRDLVPTEATWLASAIVSHHKDAHEIFELYPFGLDEGDDPLQDLVSDLDTSICQVLWQWQHYESERFKDHSAMAAMAASIPPPPPWDEAIFRIEREGAKRIRYWLGCYRRLVNDLELGVSRLAATAGFLLRGFMLQADYTASAHVMFEQSVNLSGKRILETFALEQDSLYEHQRRAARTHGSAILIAPTGSGKTEAALLWAGCQRQHEHGLPRLFYTLPYQASMNAMFDRLQSAFPHQVSLIHSRALLALYHRFLDQNYSPEEATRIARSLRDLARLHVQPVGVFSPYQMLKVAYGLKGHEAMLADYAEGAFIFDEIHAYEPERLAMILETVRYLREVWGARFLVMSATLPALVKERVIEALGDPELISATRDLYESFSRHEVHVLPGDLLEEGNMRRVVEEWSSGGAVLVTCNTVSRAQAVYRAMTGSPRRPREGQLILLHGRFNGRDRIHKEKRMLSAAALGKIGPGHRRRRPLMVISTQVVEVSLNMDMDTIYSDPAPLEALIQRFGRVNRGRRVPIAPVYVFELPTDGQGIYDPMLVQRTLEVLREGANRSLDEAQVQSWLDCIYAGEVLERWKNSYSSTAIEFRSAFLDNLIPYTTDSALEEAFNRLFDGVEVLPMGLKEKYLCLADDDPLGATQLLVPIRWGRYYSLAKAGRVIPGNGNIPHAVNAYYDPELGLDFDRGAGGERLK